VATNTVKTLTLSRPGGGKLTISPADWDALQKAVTEALQLVPAPDATLDSLPVKSETAMPLDDLPQGAKRVVSEAGYELFAEFRRIPLERPLAGHHRDNFGSD